MTQIATKFSAYTDLLRPTATGIIVAVVLSMVTLLLHQVQNFQRYLNLPSNWHIGSVLLVLVNDFLLKLFGTSRLDTIVLSIFWVLVGLVVYLFLKATILFFVEMGQDITQSNHYVQPTNRGSRGETSQLVTYTFFRLTVLIITIFYFVWMLTFFSRQSASNVTSFGHWLSNIPLLRGIIFFLLECFAWYVLTVLLRLIFMKNRLFG